MDANIKKVKPIVREWKEKGKVLVEGFRVWRKNPPGVESVYFSAPMSMEEYEKMGLDK